MQTRGRKESKVCSFLQTSFMNDPKPGHKSPLKKDNGNPLIMTITKTTQLLLKSMSVKRVNA